jgi:hypothetical protein
MNATRGALDLVEEPLPESSADSSVGLSFYRLTRNLVVMAIPFNFRIFLQS